MESTWHALCSKNKGMARRYHRCIVHVSPWPKVNWCKLIDIHRKFCSLNFCCDMYSKVWSVSYWWFNTVQCYFRSGTTNSMVLRYAMLIADHLTWIPCQLIALTRQQVLYQEASIIILNLEKRNGINLLVIDRVVNICYTISQIYILLLLA